MENAWVWLSAAAIGAALLSGRVTASQQQANLAEATRARGEAGSRCERIYPAGALQADCINDADKLYIHPFVRYPDLFDLQLSERLSVETRQAQGQITAADAQLELAKVKAETQSAAMARDNQAMSLQIQQRAAIAASMPVTCSTNWGTTTCC